MLGGETLICPSRSRVLSGPSLRLLAERAFHHLDIQIGWSLPCDKRYVGERELDDLVTVIDGWRLEVSSDPFW